MCSLFSRGWLPSCRSWWLPSLAKGWRQGIPPALRGWRDVPHLCLSRAIFLSPHTPIFGFRPFHWAACGSAARGFIVVLRHWLLSACSGTPLADLLGCSEVRPASVARHFTVRVADKVLHPTHSLQVLRHLYFCIACGKVAGRRVQQLGEACVPLPGEATFGRQIPTRVRNLRRLRHGRLPYGTPWWPSFIPLALRGQILSVSEC